MGTGNATQPLKSAASSAGYLLFFHYQLNTDYQTRNSEILGIALDNCRKIKKKIITASRTVINLCKKLNYVTEFNISFYFL